MHKVNYICRHAHVAALAIASLMPSLPAIAQEKPDVPVLVVLSDGEQDANSYATQQLASPVRKDVMALFSTPFGRSGIPEATIVAPNSNFSPSGIVAVDASGRRAYVVETKNRPTGATRLEQLVPGKMLDAYDISNRERPRLLAKVEVGARPISLDVSSDGRTVVVLSGDDQNALWFSQTSKEGLARPRSFVIPGLPADTRGFGFVQWSPVTDALAVHLPSQSRLVFLRVDRDPTGQVTGVRRWGDAVMTNKYPLVGRFSPDGRHYITSDVNWGADVSNQSEAQRGVMTLIRVAQTTDENAKHLVKAVDTVGRSAESFAISPDGRYVVASNMETSGDLPGTASFNAQSVLTLLSLDQEGDRLSKISDTRWSGILPQGITFDRSGRFVLAGTNELAEDRSSGGIALFRLDEKPIPNLVDTGIRLRTAPGVHSLALPRMLPPSKAAAQ